MPRCLAVRFAAGAVGSWRIDLIRRVAGESLPIAERLAVIEGADPQPLQDASWILRGATSNARYSSRAEVETLSLRQQELYRAQAARAALIPIRKTQSWWALAQDERRAIFEERSRHIGISLPYLPAIARRLHHSRELGEPFDFLTWFEYAPEHHGAFEELVGRLRDTEEWTYVEREVDIRLVRL